MLARELAYAVRSLRQHPGFLLTAAGTLAIGICANVTVFSMVNGVLLRPMPFGERIDRVMTLRSTHRLQAEDWDNSGVSSADLLDVRRETRSFDQVGGYVVRNFTIASANDTERLTGLSVTPNLFSMLGIEPALGRTFTPADAAAVGLESSVILTHGVWQSHYGADPNIIGRAVIINDRPQAVVGVMPPGFRFPHDAQLYAPLGARGRYGANDPHRVGHRCVEAGVTCRRRRMRTPSRRDWNRTSRRPTAATAFAC